MVKQEIYKINDFSTPCGDYLLEQVWEHILGYTKVKKEMDQNYAIQPQPEHMAICRPIITPCLSKSFTEVSTTAIR